MMGSQFPREMIPMKYVSVSSFIFLASVIGSFVVSNISQAAEQEKGTPESKTPAVKDYNETLLAHFKRPTDTASLLAYLNDHLDDDLLEIPSLIRRLGDVAFAARQKASAKLSKIGLPALSSLREAMRDADPERARMAKVTLEKMDRGTSTVVVPAMTIRLLMGRKPPELIEALLHCLPFTTDPEVEEDIYYDLKDLAVAGETIHPALLKSLEDRLPARRAVGGCIAACYGSDDSRRNAAKLLADPDAYVRLRTAQGFLARGDVSGVPTLIELLKSESITIAWQAEELLHWLAAGSAPREVVGAGADAAKKAFEAWGEWWGKNQRQRLGADKAADRLKPCLYFSFIFSSATLVGSDGSLRLSLSPKNTARVFHPLAMKPDGRLIGAAPENPKKAPHKFFIGEFDLTGNIFESLEYKNTRPPICRTMPNGYVLFTDFSKLLRCDNFLSVEDFSPKVPALLSTRQGGLVSRRLQSGIVVFQRQFGEVVWHVDPGSGAILREFSLNKAGDDVVLDRVLDLRQRILVDKDRRIVIQDYRTGNNVELKTTLSNSIDLRKASIYHLRDGTLSITVHASSLMAEIVPSQKRALVQDDRTYESLWSPTPVFTLVRFGF